MHRAVVTQVEGEPNFVMESAVGLPFPSTYYACMFLQTELDDVAGEFDAVRDAVKAKGGPSSSGATAPNKLG